jgi:phosphoribosylanthranilate isomerase
LFRIKICGVKTAKDAQLIALAGADAVGLNFYPESSRYLDPIEAEKIAATIPAKLLRVGVFVNAPLEFIVEAAGRLALNWIQLHGEEPPSAIAALPALPILKAFRLTEAGAEPVASYLAKCREIGCLPKAVLIDANRPGQLGGTGETIDWNEVRSLKAVLGEIPLVLAGGLTPFNVAEAIATAQPDAVDVASGVESKPGSKDLMLVRAFVTSAKKAFGLPAK